MAGLEAPFKYFVIDAFTSSPLKGNPAVVFLLDRKKDQECLQKMAQEFNWLTCYLTRVTDLDVPLKIPRFNLRWFGPTSEIRICGHGTLASAHAIFSKGMVQGNEVEFVTKSGVFMAKKISENQNNGETLEVHQHEFQVQLCFPLYLPVQLEPFEMKFVPKSFNGPFTINCVKMKSEENDLIVELQSSKDVTDYVPNMDDLVIWPGRAVAITAIAPSLSGFDFISRIFSPRYGFTEDYACGSIHCALAPYWSKKLGKSDLKAYMASSRGGTFMLHVGEETQNVFISGEAVTVMEGLFVV